MEWPFYQYIMLFSVYESFLSLLSLDCSKCPVSLQSHLQYHPHREWVGSSLLPSWVEVQAPGSTGCVVWSPLKLQGEASHVLAKIKIQAPYLVFSGTWLGALGTLSQHGWTAVGHSCCHGAWLA